MGTHTSRITPAGAPAPTASADPAPCGSDSTTISSASRIAPIAYRSRPEVSSPRTRDDSSRSSTSPDTKMPCAAAIGSVRYTASCAPNPAASASAPPIHSGLRSTSHSSRTGSRTLTAGSRASARFSSTNPVL